MALPVASFYGAGEARAGRMPMGRVGESRGCCSLGLVEGVEVGYGEGEGYATDAHVVAWRWAQPARRRQPP